MEAQLTSGERGTHSTVEPARARVPSAQYGRVRRPRSRTNESTHPRTPSRAKVCLTTSRAPVYCPGAAVCSRTFVKSKGWPVAAMPACQCALVCEQEATESIPPGDRRHPSRASAGARRAHAPTKTAATPPAPPEMKLLRADALCSATFSSLALSVSGLLDCKSARAGEPSVHGSSESVRTISSSRGRVW